MELERIVPVGAGEGLCGVGTLASPWLEGSMRPEAQDDGRRKRPYETNPLSEELMYP